MLVIIVVGRVNQLGGGKFLPLKTDCNVYVGTLETFIEETEIVKETETCLGE